MLSSILASVASFVGTFLMKALTDYLAHKRREADVKKGMNLEKTYADIATQGSSRDRAIGDMRNGRF